MDILLITTPPQHNTSNPAVIRNPKRLQEWIAKLPTMNVIETVRLLQNAIGPLNELQIDEAERLKLLDIYHKSFDEILVYYDELRLRSLPIAPEQRKSVAEDIMWLYLGLAGGYKIIVRNGYDAGINPKSNSSLLRAIYRAMELILHALVYACKAHEAAPPLAYLEIKQLYLYAEHYGVLDTRVKSIKDHIAVPTIGNLFKQFVLFNVVDPYRFSSEDILELFLLLEGYAPACQVGLKAKQDTQAISFYADLTEDDLPHLYDIKKSTVAGDSICYIDITPALTAIQNWVAQHKDEQSILQEKEIQLLNTFLKYAEDKEHKTPGAKKVHRSVKLLTGIKDISYYLKNKDLFLDIFADEACDGIEVQSISGDESEMPAMTKWTVIDETSAGKLIIGNKEQMSDMLHVGNVIGLIEALGDDQHPMLLAGVIRQIKAHDDDTLKLGLEILPGQPILFSFEAAPSSAVCYGLYFPPIKALKIPASLLFEKSDYANDINARWKISINDKVFLIQPAEKILETSDCMLIGFKVLQ